MMGGMKTPEEIAQDFIAQEIRFTAEREVALSELYLRGLIERAIEADRAQRGSDDFLTVRDARDGRDALSRIDAALAPIREYAEDDEVLAVFEILDEWKRARP